ncbi:hypothetical protein ANO11243_041240 [Dothideomycetidae sp. 11243]|nr:hypothetical protein ANO11243_041240 [fungal sp. No.11243]
MVTERLSSEPEAPDMVIPPITESAQWITIDPALLSHEQYVLHHNLAALAGRLDLYYNLFVKIYLKHMHAAAEDAKDEDMSLSGEVSDIPSDDTVGTDEDTEVAEEEVDQTDQTGAETDAGKK